MHPRIAAVCTPLSTVETTLSSALLSLSTSLHSLAHHLSSTPITNTTSSTLSHLHSTLTSRYHSLPSHLQTALAALFCFLLALSFVVICCLSARLYYGSDPSLLAFPLPSARYDPYDDEQSDLFIDADVRPQLVTPSRDTASLEAIDPRSGTSLGHIRCDTPPTVHDAIARARSVAQAWAATTFAQRRRVLRVLHDFVLYEQRLLCDVSCADSGKTLLEASLGEIVPTLEKLRWLCAEGEAALTGDVRTTGPMTRHKEARVEYMPLGVIAAIAPWNYPLHNLMNPVSAALFSGNAIVVKPSEHTVYASVWYGRMVRRALALCGHSAETVQVVVGGGEVGEAVVEGDVDKVFFTGSTQVGKKVAVAAAQRLLPVVLELGGKDAFVVCEDAGVQQAGSICMRGVFQNAGQNCIGVERVMVHEKVMTEFVEYILPLVKGMRLGVDMGAMTLGEAAIEGIQGLVDEAEKMGAKVLTGGKRGYVDGSGLYYEPTVLLGVTMDMRIAREEVFGPVMSLMQWSGDAELIQLVNHCPFGLGSSVFTADRRRADHIISALRVGMSNVNDFATNYLCQSMPFGGTKDSGSDKFAGIEGLRGCCIAKATTRDRFRGIQTIIPKPLSYPIGQNAFELASEINDLIFNTKLFTKIDNIRNITGMFLFARWKPRTVGSG